jgi:nitroimidazol reductase NimA-like FMN-containing flavoprotein (pyridoxamine 5'-phosphate oxidase superfamily)
MVNAPATEFVKLEDAEARAFLARQHVGRIAYSLHDRVDIEPISYTFDRGWILGRTSVGTKLATLAHHPWCAFEVDVVGGPFDWTSVVVKGTFYLLDPETGSPDVYARALASARALVSDAFSPADPAPHRSILFGVFASEVTGRSARTSTP